MRSIVFINVPKEEITTFRETLKKNSIGGCRLFACDTVQDVPLLLHAHRINCMYYRIRGENYLADLEYLRLAAHDVPKIVCGSSMGKKELINIINWGSIFYYLEEPAGEEEFVTAVCNALVFNVGTGDRYGFFRHHYIREQIDKLNKIGIALSSEHSLGKLLEQIISQALFLARCDAGSVYIREKDALVFMVAKNNTLRNRYGKGYEARFFKKYRVPISRERISGYVAETGEILNIKDVYKIPLKREYRFTDDFDRRTNYRTQSMIAAPMKDADNNVLGVLQLINCMDAEGNVIPFSKNLESLIQSIASQGAVAIQNAKLIEEVKKAHMDTIMRLSIAAEFRDDDTSDHLRRMTTYSMIVAKHLGISSREIELLQYAAPMHDIGKIGIPDSILFKPGSLTKGEWEEMKNHTIYGARILEGSSSEILAISKVVALNHHERWNGTGYPKGLKRDDIPLFGQIVSIADVFDALASKRCYKEAFNIESALEQISTSRNSMFGPHIVDAFLDGLDEILAIAKDSAKPGPAVLYPLHGESN